MSLLTLFASPPPPVDTFTAEGDWGRWQATWVDPTTSFTTGAIGGAAVLIAPASYTAPAADGSTPAGVRFWVYEPGDAFSTWHELTKVTSCTHQDDISNVGSVRIEIMNDDPNIGLITGESMIAVEEYGQIVMAGVVGTEQKKVLARDSGADAERTSFQMPGQGQLLNEGLITMTRCRWADCDAAKPIETTRRFNWTNPSFDTGLWPNAKIIAYRNGIFGTSPYWGGAVGEVWPVGLVYGGTEWLWADPGTADWAPAGTCLFREILNLGNAGYIKIFAGFDNQGSLYLDGQEIFHDVAEFRRAVESPVIEIDNGYHVIAVKGTNFPQATGNPGGVCWEVWHCDQQGNLLSLYGASAYLYTQMLPYITEEPGLPIGAIIRQVVEEAQDRGAMTAVSLGFTDYFDSDGDPWPIVTDVAVNVGRTVLDFLRDLGQTYIDWHLEPATLVLKCYNIGQMGTDAGVVFEPQSNPEDASTGSLVGLTYDRVW
jgi:hypothetical protein